MVLWVGGARAYCGLANGLKVTTPSVDLGLEFPYGQPSNVRVRLAGEELWDAVQWGEGPRYRRSVNLPGPGRYALEIETDAPAEGVLSRCKGMLIYEPEIDALLEQFKAAYAQSKGTNTSIPLYRWSRVTGRVSNLMMAESLALPGETLEAKTQTFVEQWGPIFGLEAQTTFVVTSGNNESFGRYTLLRQRSAPGGIPVIGGDVRLIFDDEGRLLEVKGSGIPELPQAEESSEGDLQNAKATLKARSWQPRPGSTPLPAFALSPDSYALEQGWVISIVGGRRAFVDRRASHPRIVSAPLDFEDVALWHGHFHGVDESGSVDIASTHAADSVLEAASPPSQLEVVSPAFYGESKEKARYVVSRASASMARFGRSVSCDGRYPSLDGQLSPQEPLLLNIEVVNGGRENHGSELGFAGRFAPDEWTLTFNDLDPERTFLQGDVAQHEFTHLIQFCGKTDLSVYSSRDEQAAMEGLAFLGSAVFPTEEFLDHYRWFAERVYRDGRVEQRYDYLNPAAATINNVPGVAHMSVYYHECPPQGGSDCIHANGAVVLGAGALMANVHGLSLEKAARLTYDMNLQAGQDDVVAILEFGKMRALHYKEGAKHEFDAYDLCAVSKALRDVGIEGSPADALYCGDDLCKPCEGLDPARGNIDLTPPNPGQATLYRCWFRGQTPVTPSSGCEVLAPPSAERCAAASDTDTTLPPLCGPMNVYCDARYVWGGETNVPVIAAQPEACGASTSNAYLMHTTAVCGYPDEARTFKQFIGRVGCDTITDWGCVAVEPQPEPRCMPN